MKLITGIELNENASVKFIVIMEIGIDELKSDMR